MTVKKIRIIFDEGKAHPVEFSYVNNFQFDVAGWFIIFQTKGIGDNKTIVINAYPTDKIFHIEIENEE